MLDQSLETFAATHAWLSAFEEAGADPARLRDLFLEDSYWRDVLGLGWEIRTLVGREDLLSALADGISAQGLSSLSRAPGRPDPADVTRVATETLEVFFTFETSIGRGEGVVRLCPDPSDGQMRAWTLLTALAELKDHEETTGARRPTGQSNSRDFRGPNWLDQRKVARAYEDREPAVLVVGAGQAGLAIAARLGALGVDTLIVDSHARIGDNWRLRYHALTLHNQVQVNHLPYLPFPPGWPTYIPKDKLANWFEAYAEAMELNVWTSTTLQSGSYDAALGQWNIRLDRKSAQRTLKPRHVVMATGVSGIPNIPAIPGLDRFQGPVIHSSQYSDGEDWSGKRALVIGTGNSGHDISQDLWSSGAAVTMVQRSPSMVVNIEPSAQLPYALYNQGLSCDDCDLITLSMPLPLVREAHQAYTKQAKALDQPLLDALKARGFRHDFGEDGTGWQFKYLTRGGGYYFNVGCSDLIAEGKIRLAQSSDIEAFTETGVQLGGQDLDFDLIVLATGYRRQEELVERLFGADVRAKIGPIWGFGDGLELRRMYAPSGQPGLWFIAGSLAQCRINSKYLALGIKAQEVGLTTDRA